MYDALPAWHEDTAASCVGEKGARRALLKPTSYILADLSGTSLLKPLLGAEHARICRSRFGCQHLLTS